MNQHDLLLPPASRLIHIGAPKTGTTSVQRAFHANRDALRRYGVHYAGPTAQPRMAALAVAGGPGLRGDRSARMQDWSELVEEIRDAGDQRVVLSSERLCCADEPVARRVVTEVPGGPVHVVVTLRSLAKIAPTQWQQYVQNGHPVPYLTWLERMFRRPPGEMPTSAFWRRQVHGDIVRCWADVVGPENLTVVVADETNPGMLLRSFEDMVGLPAGVLKPPEDGTNRSLTRGEAELVLLINKHFRSHDWTGAWSDAAYANVVVKGVVNRMKAGRRPSTAEQRLTMPDWAAQRSAELGTEAVETITSLGVRVIGDLATLAEASADRHGDEADLKRPAVIPADAAALAVLGAIRPTGRVRDGDKVGAALALLGAAGDSGGRVDQSGMPILSAAKVARTVLGVIEATHAGSPLAGLPPVPAQTAGTALCASATASGGKDIDLADARALLDALGVRRAASRRVPGAVSLRAVPGAVARCRRAAARRLRHLPKGRRR